MNTGILGTHKAGFIIQEQNTLSLASVKLSKTDCNRLISSIHNYIQHQTPEAWRAYRAVVYDATPESERLVESVYGGQAKEGRVVV